MMGFYLEDGTYQCTETPDDPSADRDGGHARNAWCSIKKGRKAMINQGEIRDLSPGEELGHAEIEVPSHHADELKTMGARARREYFRSVKAGLDSQAALACAASVERGQRWRSRR